MRQIIGTQDLENEGKAVGFIGNNDFRKDCMRVATRRTNHSGNVDLVCNDGATFEGNEIALI